MSDPCRRSAATPAHGTDGRDLTVVIPTLGRPMLRGCLASIAAGTVRPAAVVIVDQSCAAEIEHIARESCTDDMVVTYVPSSKRGRSAGLNEGIALVRTAYVAITDDDCEVAPDWVAHLLARLRERSDAIVTGRVEAGAGAPVLSVVTSTAPTVQTRPYVRFDRLSGGNMAMPSGLARKIGPFDEDPCLRTAEDAEFAYRALRAGADIVYAPEAVVHHLGWRNAAEREDQYRSYGYSQGGFYGKYLRRGDPLIAMRALVHLMRSLRRWLVGTLTGDRERARNGRAYAAGLLPGLVAGWRSGSSDR